MRKNSFLFETSPFKQLWNEFYLAVAAKQTTEDFFLLKLIRKAFLMSLIFWTVFTSRAQSNLKKTTGFKRSFSLEWGHIKVTRPSYFVRVPYYFGLTVPKLSYLGEHSEVSQARSLHACWTRMLYHDRLETIENSQSTNSAKTLEIFNVYSSLGL